MTAASRARARFVEGGEQNVLETFENTAAIIPDKLARVAHLISDNPEQRDAMARLTDLEERRLDVLRAAIQMRKLGPVDSAAQSETTRQMVSLGSEADLVISEMLANEERLLISRRAASNSLYVVTLWILAAAFAVSLILFYLYHRLLESQLRERERAEALALESQTAARQLSTRLLHLQDEELRKFSRELHDSLGQYQAAAKMSLDAMAARDGSDELLKTARAHLEQSMNETRTISYLLHPPLLDETGLGVAARWYVDGFSQRSGIQVHSEIPEDFPRVAHDAELALFRVLQECLTNIHRHAKSGRAEVVLSRTPERAFLRARDFGGGMAPEVLRHFRESGSNVGVGLAGMRERVRDQGGQLDIQSAASGVTVTVTMPLRVQEPVVPSPGTVISSEARS
jgi:signal transduction histidine kinase